MMGVEAPETCWATHKHQVINLWNYCIQLVNLFEMCDDARTFQRQTSAAPLWEPKFSHCCCKFRYNKKQQMQLQKKKPYHQIIFSYPASYQFIIFFLWFYFTRWIHQLSIGSVYLISLDTSSKFHTAVKFVTVDISYITLRYICDLSLYKTAPALLQCFIS